MGIEMREIYHSANGDRWHLVRDTGSGDVFVRHDANPPSGGQKTRIEIGDFLSRGAHGAEHQALLRLIGTLVEQPESS